MAPTPRERLEALVSEMRGFADEVDTRPEGPTAEDAEKLNKYAADVTTLSDTVRASITAEGTLNTAKAFLGEVAVPAEEYEAPEVHSSGIAVPKGQRLGELIEQSPAYQDILARYKGADGQIMKGFGQVPLHTGGSFYTDRKALVTGASATSGGAYTQNLVLSGTTDLVGERELTIRDLCTNISINTDVFEYVTITSKTNNAATVPEATSSATPGLNNVAVGAYTAAHGVKPESALALAVVTSPVETIAHLIPITRRAAADAPQVRQLVDAFLLYGIKEEEEDQILNGNGTSPNLRGILNVVGINTVGSAGTDLDAVVDGIAAIRADRRNPTGIVVHPNDWYSTGFLTAKDSAGNYLVGNPRASIDQLTSLWGLRVVVSEAMTENTLLVGDFRQAVVADRQQSTIYVSDSHNDWFQRNLLAVLAEERLGFGVLDPEGFCTVTAV